MVYRARVYLHQTPDAEPEYLGEINLDQRPVRWSGVNFIFRGKEEVGQIESIVPPAWESLGVIPAVHVVRQGGSGLKGACNAPDSTSR